MKASVLKYRFEILDAGQVIGHVGVRRLWPFALESAGRRDKAFAGVPDGLGRDGAVGRLPTDLTDRLQISHNPDKSRIIL